MENIIVVGLGEEFNRNKIWIQERFNIIAYSDNNEDLKRRYHDNFVAVNNIPNMLDGKTKIMICSTKFFYALKIQMIKLKIQEELILSLHEILQDNSAYYCSQMSFDEFIRDMELYEKRYTEKGNSFFKLREDCIWPCLTDKKKNAGKPREHYFAMDIWGGQKIFKNNPKEHYDLGSSLDGFIAHLLVFREVNYIDIRPLPYDIPGLYFFQGNAVELKEFGDESIESISSFHAIEHFGLGRYGDPVDPRAYYKAMRNIVRVTMRKGNIYIGIPIGGEDNVFFNAHRIFRIKTVLDIFYDCELVELRVVAPGGVRAEEIGKEDYDKVEEYSCGLFHFKKR